jgi:hypothetical protein
LSDKRQIAEINFEAGDHAMPQDPREIELALSAAKTAWDKYPYLELRYGERGRRFTDSDSCWLVTLARAPSEAAATKSLEWLRTVLASRGLPTVILESHLRAIAVRFADEFSVRTQFDQFLSDREAERQIFFGAAGGSQLIDAFDQRFRACSGLVVASAAELIASAWLDERAGISGAVAALRDWLTDSERFSADWIATVHALLAELDQMPRQAV